MKNINIQIVKHDECGYSVLVNDVVILECLAEDEVKEITVKDLIKLYESEV